VQIKNLIKNKIIKKKLKSCIFNDFVISSIFGGLQQVGYLLRNASYYFLETPLSLSNNILRSYSRGISPILGKGDVFLDRPKIGHTYPSNMKILGRLRAHFFALLRGVLACAHFFFGQT